MKWITLTEPITGRDAYVNMDNVFSYIRTVNFTTIFSIGSDDYIEVVETPEEIMEKIRA